MSTYHCCNEIGVTPWFCRTFKLQFCQTHDNSKHALNIIFILKKMLTSSPKTLVKEANTVKHSCHLCNLSFQNIKNASIQNLLFLVSLTSALARPLF
jgi:hypothetical protein